MGSITSPASKAKRRGRCSFALQKLCRGNLIQLVETDPEWLILIRELIEIWAKEQERQLSPFVSREKINFTLVKSESGKNIAVREHLFGIWLSADIAQKVVAPPVRDQF